MSSVVVLGAGVVGQVYASLLGAAGHQVSIVARGQRADDLRASGIVLERAGAAVRPSCRVVTGLAEAGPVDAVLVAVRGDQLSSVQAEVAESAAPTVVCMANPLGLRRSWEREIGVTRNVFAFSGVGGLIAENGAVRYHVVRQQPTVVDSAGRAGAAVIRMMESTGLPVRAEAQMGAWLATHTVFIGGLGAALLATEQGSAGVAQSRPRARELVAAISEAFDALQRRGMPVRPGALRTIFVRVPTAFATRYWQRQFDGPMVRLAIEPHVLATRNSEFPQLVGHALGLVGADAPRYRQLVSPYAREASPA